MLFLKICLLFLSIYTSAKLISAFPPDIDDCTELGRAAWSVAAIAPCVSAVLVSAWLVVEVMP